MTHLIGPNFSDMSDIDAHVASNAPALTPVKLVHTQTSLNSEGNSDNDSNELREDIEITIDQADAWGFGGRGSNATAQVSRLHNEMYFHLDRKFPKCARLISRLLLMRNTLTRVDIKQEL